MSAVKIHIAGDQRFECIQCGSCCRRWHVALPDPELRKLRRTVRDHAIPDVPVDPTTRINGHPYIAHRNNGDCVFLEPETNLCRLHKQAGEAAKPVGCRVYPLNIASTYWGEVSVTARMDCPAVQQNRGAPLHTMRSTIREYVEELGTRGGLDDETTNGLSPEAVRLIVDALRRITMPTDDAPCTTSRRALTLFFVIKRLKQLGTAFLNDTSTLAEVLPSLVERARETAATRCRKNVRVFSRAVFRQWLAAYLRRDEEAIMKGMGTRIARTCALAGILVGRSSFRRLGTEHPRIPVAEAALFPGVGPQSTVPKQAPSATDDADTWDCYWRMVRARLETLQFFGVSYYGSYLFTGLRALAQTYPLVLAAARCHARDRGLDAVDAEAVRYAVGAIDHSFGRSRFLQMFLWRQVEEFFGGTRYHPLLRGLGWQ